MLPDAEARRNTRRTSFRNSVNPGVTEEVDRGLADIFRASTISWRLVARLKVDIGNETQHAPDAPLVIMPVRSSRPILFATCPSDRFMGGVIMSSTAALDVSCRPSLAAIARAATTRFGGPRTERSGPAGDICKTSTRVDR